MRGKRGNAAYLPLLPKLGLRRVAGEKGGSGQYIHHQKQHAQAQHSQHAVPCQNRQRLGPRGPRGVAPRPLRVSPGPCHISPILLSQVAHRRPASTSSQWAAATAWADLPRAGLPPVGTGMLRGRLPEPHLRVLSACILTSTPALQKNCQEPNASTGVSFTTLNLPLGSLSFTDPGLSLSVCFTRRQLK